MKIDSTLAYLLKPSSASKAHAQGAPTPHEAAASEKTPEHSTLSPTDEVDFSAEAKSVVAEAAKQLTEAEQQQVRELQARDAEVRAHEQAHLAAAGGHARGGPTYQFKTGPDGRQYAVAGEVQIDISEVPGDPAATIAKARAISTAAHAPSNPSAADRAVAAKANRLQAQAQQELREEQRAEATTETDTSQGSSPVSETGDPTAAQKPQTATETNEAGQSQPSTDVADDEAVQATNVPTATTAQKPQAQTANIQQQILDAYSTIATGRQLDSLA